MMEIKEDLEKWKCPKCGLSHEGTLRILTRLALLHECPAPEPVKLKQTKPTGAKQYPMIQRAHDAIVDNNLKAFFTTELGRLMGEPSWRINGVVSGLEKRGVIKGGPFEISTGSDNTKRPMRKWYVVKKRCKK